MSCQRALSGSLCLTVLMLLLVMLPAQTSMALGPKSPPAPTPTPVPVITNGARDLPEIALTFDACPAKGFGIGIIQTLTETQTPATFFLSGRWIQTHITATDLLASIPYFELGDHSWDHANFARLSQPQIDLEISRTEQLLTQLTHRSGTLFRFPYGAYTRRAVQEIYRLGLTPIQWDVVSVDPAKSMTAAKLITRVRTQTQNGSIIIMHVNGRGWHTAAALPKIIEELRARGFQFVTVSHLLADQAELAAQMVPGGQ
jgi:peptidoglycan/xylan/chitin deacetylase (PgdA/CDA1 family)